MTESSNRAVRPAGHYWVTIAESGEKTITYNDGTDTTPWISTGDSENLNDCDLSYIHPYPIPTSPDLCICPQDGLMPSQTPCSSPATDPPLGEGNAMFILKHEHIDLDDIAGMLDVAWTCLARMLRRGRIDARKGQSAEYCVRSALKMVDEMAGLVKEPDL